MGTPLDNVYEMFISRIDNEVLTDKEPLIYAIFKIAVSKAQVTVRHSLEYALDPPSFGEILYDGYFTNTLDDDEIDLISLYMLYEWNKRKQQKLVAQERDIGTADFNRLPGKKEELAVIQSAMKTTWDEIERTEQRFNTYAN